MVDHDHRKARAMAKIIKQRYTKYLLGILSAWSTLYRDSPWLSIVNVQLISSDNVCYSFISRKKATKRTVNL